MCAPSVTSYLGVTLVPDRATEKHAVTHEVILSKLPEPQIYQKLKGPISTAAYNHAFMLDHHTSRGVNSDRVLILQDW